MKKIFVELKIKLFAVLCFAHLETNQRNIRKLHYILHGKIKI